MTEGDQTTHRGIVMTSCAGLWMWAIGDYADGADQLIDAQLQIDDYIERHPTSAALDIKSGRIGGYTVSVTDSAGRATYYEV